MNNILKTHDCMELSLKYPESKTWWDVAFQPTMSSIPDGTLGEWFQRQVQPFDQNIFNNILRVKVLGMDLPAGMLLTDRQIEAVQSTHLMESIFGHSVYLFVTAAVIRFFDLVFQTINNYIYTLDLQSRTKMIVRLCSFSVYYIIFLYLGYSDESILAFATISLLSKILPLKYSNKILQMSKLSNTKEFILRSFITKNMVEFAIRLIPALHALTITASREDTDASIMHCCPKDQALDPCQYGYQRSPFSKDQVMISIMLEPISLILGKMMIDLTTVVVRRKIFNGDLRDPMAWVVAPLKSIFKNYNANYCRIIEKQKKLNSEYSMHITSQRVLRSRNAEQFLSADGIESYTNDNREQVEKKEKVVLAKEKKKTHGPVSGSATVMAEASGTGQKFTQILTRFEISANDCTFIFQQLDGDAYKDKNLWGVIIADSLSQEKLKRYQGFLNNGHIGKHSSIRQLMGAGGTFEIGAGMDARLLGLMHNPGTIYNALQNYLPIEEALNLTQEIESNCGEDASLIIFSGEAKKHQDISKKSRQLKK